MPWSGRPKRRRGPSVCRHAPGSRPFGQAPLPAGRAGRPPRPRRQARSAAVDRSARDSSGAGFHLSDLSSRVGRHPNLGANAIPVAGGSDRTNEECVGARAATVPQQVRRLAVVGHEHRSPGPAGGIPECAVAAVAIRAMPRTLCNSLVGQRSVDEKDVDPSRRSRNRRRALRSPDSDRRNTSRCATAADGRMSSALTIAATKKPRMAAAVQLHERARSRPWSPEIPEGAVGSIHRRVVCS